MKLFIKKGDKVNVIAGKEKGKAGKVLRTIPDKSRVVVEGLHFTKKAIRPSQKSPQGGIITREGSVHISNVALHCATCDRPARVGYRRGEDGRRIRICGRCGSDLDKE